MSSEQLVGGRPHEIQIFLHKHGRNANDRDHAARDNQDHSVNYEQQLSPLAQQPGAIIREFRSDRIRISRQTTVHGHHQQLKQDRRYKSVKRVKVPESQEQEETHKAGRRRHNHRPPRPMHPVPRSIHRQRQVQDPYGQHRAGQRHPIMSHEIEQMRIDPANLIASQSRHGLVIWHHHTCGGNDHGHDSADQHAQSHQAGPKPRQFFRRQALLGRHRQAV